MKKYAILVLVIFLIILIVVLPIFYCNSFEIALNKAGLNENAINFIDAGIDNNGNDYRVVFQYMTNNTVKILLLTKSEFGIWHVTEETSGPEEDAEYIIMGWMRFASIRRYDVSGQPRMDYEVHKVYGGMNATKQILIPKDSLPKNVSVNVFQAGTAYVIHFISYGDAEILNQIDFSKLIKQAGGVTQ